MDIGTGIAVGCGILGTVIMVVRFFKKNNSVVTQNQFNFFVETVLENFSGLKKDIKSIHQRIDKIWEEK
jgi:hypothetical protein